MRPDLPTLLPLVCPTCVRIGEHGGELHTVVLEHTLVEEAGEVVQGTLRCGNPACRHRYPIVDGIPVLVRDLAAWQRSELLAAVEAPLDPELVGLLQLAGPDEAPYARLHEHLGIYLDAHWGDRAEPPPRAPISTRFGLAELADRLAARAAERVPRAIELGCSVGRGLAELARGADLVVGVDLHIGALRRARRLLAGHPVRFPRRIAGRHTAAAACLAGDLAAPNVALVCGDALHPPLAPWRFERVVALNLIDSVPRPAELLAVADGLCRPGGELHLASPYTWQSGIVDEDARLGQHDPAAEVVRRLTAGEGLEAPYTIEDEADLLWWLRREARSGHAFSVHYLRGRKGPPADAGA